MRSLIKMGVEVPPIARAAVSGALGAIGLIVLIVSAICLARASKRQEKLHLSNPLPPSGKKGINPGFQNPSVS